jgi:hypothetical protein
LPLGIAKRAATLNEHISGPFIWSACYIASSQAVIETVTNASSVSQQRFWGNAAGASGNNSNTSADMSVVYNFTAGAAGHIDTRRTPTRPRPGSDESAICARAERHAPSVQSPRRPQWLPRAHGKLIKRKSLTSAPKGGNGPTIEVF